MVLYLYNQHILNQEKCSARKSPEIQLTDLVFKMCGKKIATSAKFNSSVEQVTYKPSLHLCLQSRAPQDDQEMEATIALLNANLVLFISLIRGFK